MKGSRCEMVPHSWRLLLGLTTTPRGTQVRRMINGMESNGESNIVVLAFDGRYSAKATLKDIQKMQEDGLLEIEDAVVASSGPGGNLKIEQTHSDKGKFALRGSGIGLLAGLLVGGPIGGLVGGNSSFHANVQISRCYSAGPVSGDFGDLYLAGLGGFPNTTAKYWSSTEYNNNSAWWKKFPSFFQLDDGKSFNHYVRAVRAF